MKRRGLTLGWRKRSEFDSRRCGVHLLWGRSPEWGPSSLRAGAAGGKGQFDVGAARARSSGVAAPVVVIRASLSGELGSVATVAFCRSRRFRTVETATVKRLFWLVESGTQRFFIDCRLPHENCRSCNSRLRHRADTATIWRIVST